MKLTNEGFYQANIDSLKLKLQNLQETNPKAQKEKQQLENYEKIDRVLYYQSLSFILKLIRAEIIDWYYNNCLADYFGIKKTRKLVACK